MKSLLVIENINNLNQHFNIIFTKYFHRCQRLSITVKSNLRDKFNLGYLWNTPLVYDFHHPLRSPQAVLRMMCMPDSVKTGSLIWPTSSLKEASSKGFCIWLRPKNPRSPFLCAELQSLSVLARSPNVTSPATIFALWPEKRGRLDLQSNLL